LSDSNFILKGNQMSQGNFNAPPPAKSGGGMSVVIIVLIVLALLGVVCCGGCIASFYWLGKTGGGAALMGTVLPRVQMNPTVTEKFGGQIQPTGLPTSSNANFEQGATSTVDFEISGPNGKGTVHAEMTTGGPQGFTPTAIKVTAPDGTVIDVLAPASEVAPEMPDDSGDTDSTDATNGTEM
jgi:hypothetical protein